MQGCVFGHQVERAAGGDWLADDGIGKVEAADTLTGFGFEGEQMAIAVDHHHHVTGQNGAIERGGFIAVALGDGE